MSENEQKQPPKLTATVIEEALNGRYPSFGDVSPCHRSSQGCHHDVWFVGRNLILRGLPETGKPDESPQRSLDKDMKVSRLMRKYMSKSELVPQVLGTVVIEGWLCNIEVRVRGTSLEDNAAATEATEGDIAAFLEALGTIPIEEAREAINHEEPKADLQEMVPEAIEAWNELLDCEYVYDANRLVEGLLTRQLAELSALDDGTEKYRPVLVHGDISTEHVFIDQPHGTVNGIIDWSDACIGDPCMDISGLSLTFGREMARSIAQRTSYSRLTMQRGFLFAMCLVITDIQGTVCGEDEGPEELLKREFRRAFEGTGVDEVEFLKAAVKPVSQP